MRFFEKDCNVSQLSPLTLAFVGDAVFDLFVRERLVCLANRPVNRLHSLAVAQVKAPSQEFFLIRRLLFSVRRFTAPR